VPDHAPLYARKLFAARVAVVSAFADVEDTPMTTAEFDGAVEARDALLAGLKRSTTGLDQETPSDNDERLDAYLSRQCSTRIGGFATNASASSNAQLLKRLKLVEDRYGTLSCAACAACRPMTPPCRAENDDDLLVSACGECIREVKGIYSWAESFAASVYDDALGSSTTPVASLVECVLSTASNPAALTASTTFVAGDPPRSLIQLNFPETAETRDFATIPYAFTHELVAHAFQGALSGAARAQRGAFEEWSEGWMDCVAYGLLRDHIDRARPVIVSAPPPFTTVQLRSASQTMHDARYSVAMAPAPRGSRLREVRARFVAMEGRIRSCVGDAGRVTFLQALLVLNASGAPREAVNGVLAASAFFREGVASGHAELTSAEFGVFQALVRYRDHRNAHELLREMFV